VMLSIIIRRIDRGDRHGGRTGQLVQEKVSWPAELRMDPKLGTIVMAIEDDIQTTGAMIPS